MSHFTSLKIQEDLKFDFNEAIVFRLKRSRISSNYQQNVKKYYF